WSSNGILFMLATILTQRGIPHTQAIRFQLVQALVVGYTACGFLIDIFGCRPVPFLYYFVGAFFHLWFAQAAGWWMCAAIAAVGWVNPGDYGSTGIYVSELHPAHLRSTACGLVLRHRARRLVAGAGGGRLHAAVRARRLRAAHLHADLPHRVVRAAARRRRDQRPGAGADDGAGEAGVSRVANLAGGSLFEA